jgi:hypothetical protein
MSKSAMLRNVGLMTVCLALLLGAAAPTASAFCVGQPPDWWFDQAGGPCEQASLFPPDIYVCVTSFPVQNCV